MYVYRRSYDIGFCIPRFVKTLIEFSSVVLATPRYPDKILIDEASQPPNLNHNDMIAYCNQLASGNNFRSLYPL